MAKFCPKCGTEIKEGENFCSNCGNTEESTEQVNTTVTNTKPAGKSKMAAGLLGIFLGGWGIHNFYLERYCSNICNSIHLWIWCYLGTY